MIFSWPFQGGGSFVVPFYDLCFVFVFDILFCLFIAALWSPAGKGLTSSLCCVYCFSWVFDTFPYGVLRQVWYLIVSKLCLLPYLISLPVSVAKHVNMNNIECVKKNLKASSKWRGKQKWCQCALLRKMYLIPCFNMYYSIFLKYNFVKEINLLFIYK